MDVETNVHEFSQILKSVKITHAGSYSYIVFNFSPINFPNNSRTTPRTNGNFHARTYWLAPLHPNHCLLNRSTYYKSAKAQHHPVPKSYGHPKSMNKLTLNEPAKKKSLKYG